MSANDCFINSTSAASVIPMMNVSSLRTAQQLKDILNRFEWKMHVHLSSVFSKKILHTPYVLRAYVLNIFMFLFVIMLSFRISNKYNKAVGFLMCVLPPLICYRLLSSKPSATLTQSLACWKLLLYGLAHEQGSGRQTQVLRGITEIDYTWDISWMRRSY